MAEPIVKLIQEENASEDVKQTYRAIQARYGGRLPDICKAFAHDPEYLASINEHMQRVLRPRKVDAKTKEVIAFVVPAMNGCDSVRTRTSWGCGATGRTTRRSPMPSRTPVRKGPAHEGLSTLSLVVPVPHPLPAESGVLLTR